MLRQSSVIAGEGASTHTHFSFNMIEISFLVLTQVYLC